MCYYGTCIAKGCTYDENKCTGKKALGKSLLSVDDLVSGWNGSSYGMHTKTALLEALASELGDYYYMWTKDLRNDDCEAFYVATDGFVGYGNRANSGGNLAVCR